METSVEAVALPQQLRCPLLSASRQCARMTSELVVCRQTLRYRDWVQQISPSTCLHTGRCAESVAFFLKFAYYFLRRTVVFIQVAKVSYSLVKLTLHLLGHHRGAVGFLRTLLKFKAQH